jgi:transcriptional regulator with XRE-family HTH domain
MAGADDQFPVWLETQLRARRMSLRQLADRSGVNPSTVSRIVQRKRRPTLRTALRITRVLDPVRGEALLDLPVVGPSGGDPVTNVERALRADPDLTDAAISRLMTQYLNLRSDGGRDPARAGRPAHGVAPGGVGRAG